MTDLIVSEIPESQKDTFIKRMTWERKSKYRIESPEGYMISRSRVDEDTVVYIARAPKETGYVYTGDHCDEAKAACEEHLARAKS